VAKKFITDQSSGLTSVELQHSAETLLALERILIRPRSVIGRWKEEDVVLALVVSFLAIVLAEFAKGSAQAALSERHELREAL